MTVAELIEKLRTLNPEARVVIRGEEYDWTENIEVFEDTLETVGIDFL